ncbi:MAG TPA: type II secretion system protein [Alphaproteobacteria bacterium]|nr:type II secretion system protein [Alphaproteobacteria bacterium]
MTEYRYQKAALIFLIPDPCLLPSEGFTLVEMAVVLIVIGLIVLAVFPALTALRMSGQRTLTQSNLNSLMRATAAYAEANGCLPCPTPASTIGSGFGRVRGDGSASPAACGACAAPEGIAPFMSLGLPAEAARDGWGHWITMRVDPALTVNPANSANPVGVVPPFAPCTAADLAASPVTASCRLQGASQKGLCRTGLAAAGRIDVTTPGNANPQQTAVIFVSYGAQGYGSFSASVNLTGTNGAQLPFPSSMPACSASEGFTRCNAAGTTQFVDAPITVGGGDPYDDLLAYADRNTLLSMFGNGSCQTVW